jgi:molybdate transport system ATP-binding protein
MARDASLSVRAVVAPERGRGFALDVSFEVPPGITILFGPSGSGKSTTLAVLSGLLRPSSGRVALGEEVWFDADRRIHLPPHRRGVSIVFQSLALFPHLTAAANVEYGIDRKLPASARMQRARDMLARMKVGQLADRKPSTFSGGEAQRVALARAFARPPRVLLLDEAFSRDSIDGRGAGHSGAGRHAQQERGAGAGGASAAHGGRPHSRQRRDDQAARRRII